MVNARTELKALSSDYFSKQLKPVNNKKMLWSVSDKHYLYHLSLEVDRNSSQIAVQYKAVFYKSPRGEEYYDMFECKVYKPKWSLLKSANMSNQKNVPELFQNQLKWLYFWNNRPWILSFAGPHLQAVSKVIFPDIEKKFLKYVNN